MGNIAFFEMKPRPGIQRDGTDTDSDQCIAGSWARFYKERPKKMGGYKFLQSGDFEIIRLLYSYDTLNAIELFIGRPSSLTAFNVGNDLLPTDPVDLTPAGFVSNVNNLWSMTTLGVELVGEGTFTYIVATACPNGSDISNDVPGLVYYSDITQNTPLIPIINSNADNPGDPIMTTGGVLALGSYLLVYGANGQVIWNEGGVNNADITDFPADHQLQQGSSKFVAGFPVRTGETPTGILWSLSAVSTISLDPTGTEEGQFVATYASTVTSILSANCVVPYEPVFFWIGINTFYTYNGSVVEVENFTNKLWFFANLNQDAKEKIVGFVNKEYHEVWWLCPMFGSSENNWALIYNTVTQQWYDTPINRSAAVSPNSQFQYPILASSQIELYNNIPLYPIWAHEYGVDREDPNGTTALMSTFTTNRFWGIDQNPQAQVINYDSLIPDVSLDGTMYVTVNTQGYPNSPVVVSPTFAFTQSTEFLTLNIKGSITSFTFTSNELGGNYLFGKTMFKIMITDDQRPGPSGS